MCDKSKENGDSLEGSVPLSLIIVFYDFLHFYPDGSGLFLDNPAPIHRPWGLI